MFKLATLAALAGLAIATSTLPSAAQFIAGIPPGAGSKVSSDCAYPLNYIPRVTRSHIESIQHQPVYLTPVCEDGLIGQNDDYGWLFVWGNVDTLRVPIAENPVLMAALMAQGYDQHDVVSLRFGGGDSVTLYVHQRTMR